MSVSTVLRKASFRGIRFHVKRSEQSAGFQYKIHSFPGGRQKAFAEALSEKPEILPLEAFLVGPDASVTCDLLLEACRKEGPGRLLHPRAGYMEARCLSFQVTESSERIGCIRISMEFIRHIPDETQSPGLAELMHSAEALMHASMLSFCEEMEVLSLPSYALGGISSAAEKIRDFIRSCPASPLEDAQSSLALIQKDFRELLRDTGKAAEAVRSSIQSLPLKQSIRLQQKIRAEHEEEREDSTGDEISESRRKEVRSVAAFQSFAAVSALVSACQDFQRLTAAEGLSSPLLLRELTQQKESLIQAMDHLLPLLPDASCDSLFLLRSSFLRRSRQLSSSSLTETLHLSEALPALVIAAERYQDLSREGELISAQTEGFYGMISGKTELPRV